MEKRFKNWRTTIMGVLILAFGVLLWWNGKVNAIEGMSVLLLGWVFIAAKDTLIEGITLGLFKITPKP